MDPIEVAVKSLLVASVGLIAIALMRRTSASTRHLALLFALLGVCALPFASKIVPTWSVPIVKVAAPKVSSVQVETNRVATISDSSISEVGTGSIPEPQPSFDLGKLLLAGWAVGSLVVGIRLGARLLYLRRMERGRLMTAEPELQAIVAHHCRESRRHVLLLEGEENEPPMTWGHFRPVLLLPKDAIDWPADRLRSVVLHELAHIERADWLISIFAQLVTAVFWFNPAVWLIAKRMDWESEIAADDRVLNLGVSGPQYASHLLDLLRQLKETDRPIPSAMAMARPGQIDGRIRSILEARRSRRSTRGSVALCLLILVALFVALVGALDPTQVDEIEAHKTSIQASRTMETPTVPPAPPKVEIQATPAPDSIPAPVPAPLPKSRLAPSASEKQTRLEVRKIYRDIKQAIDRHPKEARQMARLMLGASAKNSSSTITLTSDAGKQIVLNDSDQREMDRGLKEAAEEIKRAGEQMKTDLKSHAINGRTQPEGTDQEAPELPHIEGDGSSSQDAMRRWNAQLKGALSKQIDRAIKSALPPTKVKELQDEVAGVEPKVQMKATVEIENAMKIANREFKKQGLGTLHIDLSKLTHQAFATAHAAIAAAAKPQVNAHPEP